MPKYFNMIFLVISKAHMPSCVAHLTAAGALDAGAVGWMQHFAHPAALNRASPWEDHPEGQAQEGPLPSRREALEAGPH